MKQKLSAIQTQKHILAPIMQKSISILLLPMYELNHSIELELQENPMLEIDEDLRRMKESLPECTNTEERLVNLYRASDDPIFDNTKEREDSVSRPIVKRETLADHLMKQLRLEITNPQSLEIGEYIIGSIDKNGFLASSCEQIATDLKLSTCEPVEAVLAIIRQFDPAGVASRNVQECLLIQAGLHLNGQGELVSRVIKLHFEDIGKKRYDKIARHLKISIERVKEIAQCISKLEPKPARKFDPIQANLYVKPDIFVIQRGGNLFVEINSSGIPPLRINPYYRKMLEYPNLSEEEKTFIRQKFEGALHFIKSIQQRDETIKRISNYIVEKQKEFFENGPSGLKPLALKEVAEAVGRDESTVCRAIRNKYIDSRQGVFPLKFFFSTALPQKGKDHIAAQGLKEEIRSLIDAEDKSSPFSDKDIQEYFSQKGISVARRTITKYRQKFLIPPSHLRKK